MEERPLPMLATMERTASPPFIVADEPVSCEVLRRAQGRFVVREDVLGLGR